MTRFQYVAMLAVVVIATALCSWGQFAISVSFGPPVLPVYAQPLCPAPGYIWTPGYWAWDPNDGAYYWVPGTWVLPPTIGLLWTPGYWGFVNGAYVWYDGYWGPAVGFYGGITYGFGYPGNGYYGGEWRGREFYYNRTVNNVNVTNITNVYNQTVPNNNINRVAYNNGPNGVQAQPTQQQIAARQQHHDLPTAAQTEHQQAARKDPAQFASANGGNPAVVATPKPGALSDPQAKRAALPPAPTPPANAATNKPGTQNNRHLRGQQNVPSPSAADEQATHTPPKNAAARRQAEPPQQQAPPPRMQQPQPQKEQPNKQQQPPQ